MTQYFQLDHRYAQSQMRHSLLGYLISDFGTLATVAEKTGLKEDRLVTYLAGHGGLSYLEMNKISTALFNADLQVVLPWELSGVSISGEDDITDPEELDQLKLRNEAVAALWQQYKEKKA